MLTTAAVAALLSPLHANTAAPSPATASPTATSPAHWGSDLPAALAQAQHSGKAVLLVFTGSDWCPPCKMLKQNVFDTTEFAAYAQKNFELVEIDLPKGNHITEEQRAANQALAQGMNITGFPTVLLLNQDGAIINGFVGYRDLSTAQELWNKALSDKSKLDADIAHANKLQGLDKAKALLAINQQCPDNLRPHNTALVAQIIAVDTADILGLGAAAAKAAAEQAAQQEVEHIINTTPPEQMLSVLDQQLARTDLSPELEQTLKWVRLNTQLMNAQSVADIAQVKEGIIQYGKQYPSQQAQVDRVINGIFSMPMEDILQRIKAIRP